MDDTENTEGEAVEYFANFTGDEVDGVTYAEGDKIKAGVDAGTLAYLTRIGRISAKPPKAKRVRPPKEDKPPKPPKEPKTGDELVLSDEERASVKELVDGNSKDELLKLAEGVEGVAADNNKDEIAAKIIVSRRPPPNA